MPEQSVKLCECGCGEPAAVAKKTDRSRGWIQGQSLRFAHGHNSVKRHGWVEEDRGYETPCWIWQGGLDQFGYGQTYTGGRNKARVKISTHRLAWITAYGPIPDGQWVLHRCDVPTCINPAHLFLGSNLENIADMVSKRRHAHGERNGGAKLTPDQVREIRAAQGVYQRDLAKRYGVSQTTIHSIRAGHTWKLTG